MSSRIERPSWDEYYLALAFTVSWRASCLGRKVGAVVVQENRIVSTGYNGTPEGWPNCSEDECGCRRCYARHSKHEGVSEAIQSGEVERPRHRHLDECVCVHAEANALLTAARFGIPLYGSDIYVTDQPCLQCSKQLLQVGVKRLVFQRPFHVVDGKAVDTTNNHEVTLAREVLSDHHQLMSSLSAWKYTQRNVVEDLKNFAESLVPKIDGELATSTLEDVQFPLELAMHAETQSNDGVGAVSSGKPAPNGADASSGLKDN